MSIMAQCSLCTKLSPFNNNTVISRAIAHCALIIVKVHTNSDKCTKTHKNIINFHIGCCSVALSFIEVIVPFFLILAIFFAHQFLLHKISLRYFNGIKIVLNNVIRMMSVELWIEFGPSCTHIFRCNSILLAKFCVLKCAFGRALLLLIISYQPHSITSNWCGLMVFFFSPVLMSVNSTRWF